MFLGVIILSIGGIIINIENYLQNIIEEFGEENVNHLINLYRDISSDRLKKVFSKAHYEINNLLKYLNDRLPRGEYKGHYTAQESRLLIKWINTIKKMQYDLKESEVSFEIAPYYGEVLDKCKEFLNEFGGSPIPEGFVKTELILLEPVFFISKTISIVKGESRILYPIKPIGEGSYAKVFKYKDEFYDKYFVIKRAKKDLTTKELERFKREYIEMKKLKSPYVIEVYNYNIEKNEYIMEYADETLLQYISAHNNIMTKDTRRVIVLQIIKALEYIHSLGLLHRDISLTNVLLKKYDGLVVVKISDFGLVKIPESNLTSTLTELKGSLNDPDLEIFGFKNYKIVHETYAITRLIHFIMTGRNRIQRFEDVKLEQFVMKGLDKNLENRYQSIQELRDAFLML